MRVHTIHSIEYILRILSSGMGSGHINCVQCSEIEIRTISNHILPTGNNQEHAHGASLWYHRADVAPSVIISYEESKDMMLLLSPRGVCEHKRHQRVTHLIDIDIEVQSQSEQ